MDERARIPPQGTVGGPAGEDRAPAASVRTKPVPVHAELRPRGKPAHRALPRQRRQDPLHVGIRRRARHVQQRLAGIEELDLFGIRVDGVADAARARVDRRHPEATFRSMGVDAALERADGEPLRRLHGGDVERDAEAQARDGREVHVVARPPAPHARVVRPIGELRRRETEFRPFRSEIQPGAPTRTVALLHLEPARLRPRVALREEADERMSLQRQGRRGRVPEQHRGRRQAHARRAVRPRHLLDHGRAASARAHAPPRRRRQGERHRSRRNRPRVCLRRDPRAAALHDGLVEGVAAAGPQFPTLAQVVHQQPGGGGRERGTRRDDEEVKRVAAEDRRIAEFVARHARHTVALRQGLFEDGRIAHAAECVRPHAETEVQHRHARNISLAEVPRRPPRRGRGLLPRTPFKTRGIFGRRRVGCRLRPRLHLGLRTPRRATPVEAEDKPRLGGSRWQFGQCEDEARPVLRALQFHRGVVRGKSLRAGKAIEGDVGESLGVTCLRLHPGADRVGRLRLDAGDGVRDHVPRTGSPFLRGKPHGRAAFPHDGHVNLRARPRPAVRPPPLRQADPPATRSENRIRQEILRDGHPCGQRQGKRQPGTHLHSVFLRGEIPSSASRSG